MQSKAARVADYLASLPADRRAEIETVRAVVNANLDRSGYEERMGYGMICWVVPHRVFPAGYHCDPELPLPFAGLAAQKNYCSVYVPLVVPADVPGQGEDGALHRWFVAAWQQTGKKLAMGKCCIRFKRADDLALDVLGELIRRLPAKTFVANYVAALEQQQKRGPKPRAEIRAEVAARKAAAREAAAAKAKTKAAKAKAKAKTARAAQRTTKAKTKARAKPAAKSRANGRVR